MINNKEKKINSPQRLHRLSRSYTLEELGEASGVTVAKIRTIEKSLNPFNNCGQYKDLIKIADLFEISVDEYLGITGIYKSIGEELIRNGYK